MKEFITSPKFITITVALLALVVIPLTIIQVQNQQIFQPRADEISWATSQSATAACPTEGSGVEITASFTNTEPRRTNTDMTVTVKDQQSGKTATIGTVRGGETKSAVINTERETLNAGSVTFSLTWTDGHSGVDSRTATYKAVGECKPPVEDPEYPVCPTGTTKLGEFSGELVANGNPKSQTYKFNLPTDRKIGVIGFAKEGHPESCPNGANCGQGQEFEEFSVLINDQLVGETTDKGADVEEWYEVGPWETESNVSKGEVIFKVAHRLRNTNGPESVNYKLVACTVPDEPTPSPTVCPTLGPVQNVKIECPNCP